mmetsp:Transcript_3047/g.4351  ORF Transcript_3047/g.4351 Transcript_3047/m.4351 type:complete len:124 (+) Transcript_3047:120-491(+)
MAAWRRMVASPPLSLSFSPSGRAGPSGPLAREGMDLIDPCLFVHPLPTLLRLARARSRELAPLIAARSNAGRVPRLGECPSFSFFLSASPPSFCLGELGSRWASSLLRCRTFSLLPNWEGGSV